MEEIGNKYLYNNKTEKIRTKKIVPIRQIIIRKNGTKVNTIFKEISNIPHKIKRYSNLYNSAIFSRGKYNEIQTLTDKINLSNKINEPKEILNYKTSVNKTIVKPVIYQESFLKPIILPVNVKYFDAFENQDYNQLTATNNSQTIDISKDIKNKNLQKIKHKFFPIEKIDTNKENINQNINSNYNTESNYTNYRYNNKNQFKKCNNPINQRFTEFFKDYSFIGNSEINVFYSDKNKQRFFAERKRNIDYSKLNLYSPKENKNDHFNFGADYLKKSRDKIKSDIINNDVSDTLSFFTENNYKTFNDNHNNKSFIYIRKNSSKKLLMKNKNNSFKSTNKDNNFKKIRVNLKPNSIFENALFVQKNVILIQKNYRMHLACLKKYILKAIKNIIEGTNKLYYIFYRYYFTKMIYILNNAYIRSIDINMKTAKIIPKFNNKVIINEKNKNNELMKPKHYYVIMNDPEKKKKLDIKNYKKLNFIYSPKSNIVKKTKFQDSNLNKIQKEITIIRYLKSKIINKLNNYKK